MRSQIIFADQDKQKEEKQQKSPSNKKMLLSKDEYRNAIKEAYKEGMREAFNESSASKSKGAEKQSIQEGHEEAIKSEAKNREQTRHKLENIAERHDIELLRIKGVFPFDLFPDTLIIDTTKVTIVKSQMFATENIITIPLKDLADAHVQTALFLASLTIAYMPQASSPGMLKPEEDQISCLKRADAIRAKNIMKGVMIAQSEKIDISKLSPEEVFSLVEKFGHSEGVT